MKSFSFNIDDAFTFSRATLPLSVLLDFPGSAGTRENGGCEGEDSSAIDKGVADANESGARLKHMRECAMQRGQRCEHFVREARDQARQRASAGSSGGISDDSSGGGGGTADSHSSSSLSSFSASSPACTSSSGAIDSLEQWLALFGLSHIFGTLDDYGAVTVDSSCFPWDNGIRDMDDSDIAELRLSEHDKATFCRALTLHKDGKTTDAATAAAVALGQRDQRHGRLCNTSTRKLLEHWCQCSHDGCPVCQPLGKLRVGLSPSHGGDEGDKGSGGAAAAAGGEGGAGSAGGAGGAGGGDTYDYPRIGSQWKAIIEASQRYREQQCGAAATSTGDGDGGGIVASSSSNNSSSSSSSSTSSTSSTSSGGGSSSSAGDDACSNPQCSPIDSIGGMAELATTSSTQGCGNEGSGSSDGGGGEDGRSNKRPKKNVEEEAKKTPSPRSPSPSPSSSSTSTSPSASISASAFSSPSSPSSSSSSSSASASFLSGENVDSAFGAIVHSGSKQSFGTHALVGAALAIAESREIAARERSGIDTTASSGVGKVPDETTGSAELYEAVLKEGKLGLKLQGGGRGAGDGRVKVSAVLAGGQADVLGVREGDEVVAVVDTRGSQVSGIPVKGKSMMDVTQLIDDVRRLSGQRVALSLLRRSGGRRPK